MANRPAVSPPGKGRMIRMAESNEETVKELSSTQLSLERTILSHERTLMSWVRTSTSLITFGFTIYKFFQLELQNRPPLQGAIGPRQFAVLMISIGLFSLMIAHRVSGVQNRSAKTVSGDTSRIAGWYSRCDGIASRACSSRGGSLQDVAVTHALKLSKVA